MKKVFFVFIYAQCTLISMGISVGLVVVIILIYLFFPGLIIPALLIAILVAISDSRKGGDEPLVNGV